MRCWVNFRLMIDWLILCGILFKEEIMPEGFEIEDDDDPEDEATIIQGDFLGR